MRCLESNSCLSSNLSQFQRKQNTEFQVLPSTGKEKRKGKTKQLTWDKRHRSDSIWFLATESPINASVFPRTMSKQAVASNLGRSHLSGFHLQLRKSWSFLPFLKQFFEVGIVAQLEFVYIDPSKSGTQLPLNKSHLSSSTKPTQNDNQRVRSLPLYI